jgi:TolB protein
MKKKQATSAGKIAFALGQHGVYDIWSVDPTGENPFCLVHNSVWNDYPRWSPDGTELMFSSNMEGVFGIYKLNLNSRELKPVHVSHTWDGTANWSPDGTSVVFASRRTGDCNLWFMKPEGERFEQLTFDCYVDYDPVFSPSGEQIAFISNRSGSEEIWLLEFPSLRMKKLTELKRRCFSPAWSPNGEQIAFISANKQDGYQVRMLNWKTGESNVVAIGPMRKRSLCWSPDGSYMLFSGMGGEAVSFDLWLASVQEQKDRKLLRQPLIPMRNHKIVERFDKYHPNWIAPKA